MNITKPNRVTRTYTQKLIAEPSIVFPLLCPVREVDWIEGWNPELVISQSGVAELDCVFVTAASSTNAIWYITKHEPSDCFVEMIKITPGVTACKLSIQVQPVKSESEAIVTYTHTSLGREGDSFVDLFTEERYTDLMRDWEARLNHYLSHGTMLHSE